MSFKTKLVAQEQGLSAHADAWQVPKAQGSELTPEIQIADLAKICMAVSGVE